MALGERNSNNQNGRYYEPVTMSNFIFSNAKAELEKTQLYFEYWRGFLKVSIAPLKDIDANGVASYDKEKAISIYLRHPKAYVLLKEIEKFEANPEAHTNMGISSGSGLISISNGKELGYDTPCLIIRRVNPNTGDTEASTAFVFRNDVHHAIRDYNEDTKSYESVFDEYTGVDLSLIKLVLSEFIAAGTSAYSGDLITKMGYAHYRTNQNIEAIANKLGVDFANRNKATKSSASYFNKSNNGNTSSSKPEYTSATIDDIDNL